MVVIVTVTAAKSVFPIHWEYMWTQLREPFQEFRGQFT